MANLPFGLNAARPGSLRTISKAKMKSFVIGKQTKSKFQLKKERKLAKERKEQEAAAKVYEEFVASFNSGASARKAQAFVPSASSSKKKFSGFDTRRKKSNFSDIPLSSVFGSDADKPNTKPKASKRKKPTKKKSEMELLLVEMQQNQSQRPKRTGGKRDIDLMLEEFKQRPPTGLPFGGGGGGLLNAFGSYDDGDPATTNLYVGNLAPTVTEEVLIEHFGRYGDIASVKIMWPRSEEEKSRQRNCGFVSFKYRPDAEDGKEAMSNKDLHGYELRIGWGKAVKASILNRPAVNFIRPPAKTIPPEKMTPADKARNAAQAAASALKLKTSTVAGNWDQAPVAPTKPKPMPSDALKVRVEYPKSALYQKTIDMLAEYVCKDGQAFESLILEREKLNKTFKFLFAMGSPTNRYYRWRVYSLTMGDTLTKYRTEPFQMFINGPYWIPPNPELAAILDVGGPRSKAKERSKRRSRSSSRSRSRSRSRERDRRRDRERDRDRSRVERDRDRQKEYRTGREREKAREAKSRSRGLSDREYDEFTGMLRKLTLSRTSVCNVMGLALDSSEASKEIVQALTESLTIKKTAATKKVARLYVVSDILHNSSASVRNASSYRTHFQEKLPDIFESLGITYRSIESRLQANQMLKRVKSVLKVWEEWSLYPPLFIMGLEMNFTGPGKALAVAKEVLKGLDEKGLDVEELRRKCRQAGLPNGGSAKELLIRLHCVNDYAKRRAAGVTTTATGPTAPQLTPHAASEQQRSKHLLTRSSTENLDGENLDGEDLDGEDLDGEDLDGEDLDGEDLDGEDLDGEDLDGEDLDGEDLDGEDLDGEDLDGAPMSDDEEGPGRINLLDTAAANTSASAGAVPPQSPAERKKAETRRKMLRQVEVEVEQLRDTLEREGKSTAAVTAACEMKRGELIAQCEAKIDGSKKDKKSAKKDKKSDKDKKSRTSNSRSSRSRRRSRSRSSSRKRSKRSRRSRSKSRSRSSGRSRRRKR